ncbi:Cof-type HAD-IIB family hydrolase [Moraxella nasibovis]|uniref:Cof-type HAD-IIB family hydrolase n=1 Tax=Moraxella nasibovis TaxID=2904120 RepID=UPI002410337D|nr:Cof-type HAD-IIB family hydrolase [Moraxella nasibovis]WFF38894.1 Cof-type HAD-IIB family hydrolase [Moraxella nasibovis]
MTTPTLPKIIFFDIDDTLYIKFENRIPDSTKLALHQLKAKGIIVAIATGRGICVFPPCVRELVAEVGIDVFVTINGQYNEYRGSPLVDFPLTPAQIRHTTDYLTKENIAYGYMTRDEIIGFHETPPMTHALNSLHIPYRIADEFDMNTPVYQILAFYENNKTANLELGENLKTVRWHISGVDILDKDGSKARGIRAVLDKLGLTMADAWAFGDGLNDIEMLSSVGFGVAMGNAHDDLKAVADYVCPSHKDDGIFRGLQMLGVI